MNTQFEIKFDFPLDHSSYTIALKANVQFHPLESYYRVDSFLFEETDQSKSLSSLLPGIEIKYIKTDKKGIWVHKDSERESSLSSAIGKAIEKVANLLINPLLHDTVK